MKFKEKLYRFMYGRYGSDDLSKFLLIIYVILAVVDLFVSNPYGSIVLWISNLILFFFIFYRMFSKKTYRRMYENQIYLKIKNKFVEYFKYLKNKWKYRKTHVYRKCPSCKCRLKLPKKKGKHGVKCPKCSNNFNVKI